MPSASVETPFGVFSLVESSGALTALHWARGDLEAQTPVLKEAIEQVEAYVGGRLRAFDLPLRVEGSVFQQAVCAEIRAIPFGETRTYGEIAQNLGAQPQAVGRACGANPLPILIPCHRVMGAKGLTGFSGGSGVETKLALLKHEGAGGFLI